MNMPPPSTPPPQKKKKEKKEESSVSPENAELHHYENPRS